VVGENGHLRAEQIANNEPNKRQTQSPADNLVCPITLELPWDPVTADDGRVYDRSAIQEHFKHHHADLKSPVTNEKMGDYLLPAVQHKNTIEFLLENGMIVGELATKWNEKVKQHKEREDLLSKAQDGDTEAMYKAGVMYAYGLCGFMKDAKLALKWYKKAQAGAMLQEQPAWDSSCAMGVVELHCVTGRE
jgi:U-box domain